MELRVAIAPLHCSLCRGQLITRFTLIKMRISIHIHLHIVMAVYQISYPSF